MKKYLVILLLFFSNAATADLKLYLFDCGHLSFDDVTNFGLSNDDTDVRELIVPCYVIEHEDGRMLWDAGLPLDMVSPRAPGATAWYENSFIDQLAAMGLSPDDFRFAAFSHMHFDHVGAANEFKDSTLLIQEVEYNAAFEHSEEIPMARESLFEELKDSQHILLKGDYDVFGDGTVKIISAPGHTPGHQALYLELENYGPLVLSGDLYHFEATRRLRRTPVFNTDPAQSLLSMDKVEALVKETGAKFWIGHSLELANSLNLAPAYYD
ncbi:MAG: N-acyl homoserine lactonase family protein [Gammaproteobacteria bacterium]|nr:N-acyl homoserine lactonase family protein [Gammaproteobacteria bacterium]